MNLMLPLRSCHFIGLILALSMASACSAIKVVEWTEDARLADGRVIRVDRTQEFERVTDVGAGFQSGWLFKKSSFRASLPSPASREVSWEGSLVPILIDILPDGRAVLVGYAQTGRAGREWRLAPDEYDVPFVHDKGWTRVSLADLPPQFQPNLLGATYTLFIDEGGRSGMHVDLDMKARIYEIPRLRPKPK